jgi:hypothetical protein
VGTKTNGESGAQPAGCTLPECDGHIDLNIPVVDLATDESVTITLRYLFGETCEWDCEPLPDGQVGITDFLKLLADWDAPSPCDFDGGGVGIVDFLKLLANWGPCMPAQLTNCCLPIDLEAYCQDPSTDPPEACEQLTCADCEAQGGLCVEECNLVEQTITVVNESAPAGGERHSTWTALVCAPKSACVCGNLVDALFTPATDCAGGQGTFIDFQFTPIPADFFFPGSDPFFQLACLQGVPLGPTTFGDYGLADTLVLRAADPFDCAAPPGGPVQIEVEIVELSLTSISPVTVTANGGQNPQQWDLDIDLSVLPQLPGQLNATKTHSNGGTFESVLPVLPRLTFTQVGNPGNVRVLDFGQEGIPPIQLASEGPTDWVHEVKLGTLKPEGPPSCFNPGISEDNP